MFASQQEGAMPTEVFATYVVGKVLKNDPSPLRYVRFGKWSSMFWFLSWVPRTWVLTYLAKRFMGPW
jgi:hypothetical protein